jgi:hypothetical protein
LSFQLTCLGFIASKCWYFNIYHHKSRITISIPIYNDAIVVASSSKTATDSLLKDLSKEFVLKDIGDLHFFLGIEGKK